MMPSKSSAPAREGSNLSENCLSEAQILRYMEMNLSEAETLAVETHINSCENCFELVDAVTAYSHTPPTVDEVAAFEKAYKPNPEAAHAKLFLKPSLSPAPPQKSWWAKSGDIIKSLVSDKRWQPAFAVALLTIILAGGSWQGIVYYRTSYQVAQAEDGLLESHKIYLENARLSGGYASTGIFKMSGEESHYLEDSKSRLQRAMQNGAKSPKARQLLAQIFIIEESFAAADSVLNLVDEKERSSAAWLNDTGVLYFHQKNWERAAYYFEAAIASGENLPEARYNLALAKLEMGARGEAIAVLEEYLPGETNEGWRNAAARLLNRLKEQHE